MNQQTASPPPWLSASSSSSSSTASSVNCPNQQAVGNGIGSGGTSSGFVWHTLKRRNNKVVVPLGERVTLERAFGFTITSNARLSQSCDGTVAYLAGCVIVLYNIARQTQEFIISAARKTLTTLAFSSDGKFIATGEVMMGINQLK